MSAYREFSDLAAEPAVRGFLHEPPQPNGAGLVLTHGAGANCQSKLLIALASAFADAGYLVLRCDLPFRQSRPHGPPFPAMAARDRAGLRRAVDVMRSKTQGRIFLGGHSYGGRQGSMLAAEQPQLVAGLLLLSYPLHPPRKPAELRTAHFPQLKTPSLFVHGGRDPFGSHDEMKAALALVPARTMLLEIEGAGHELLGKKTEENLPARIVQAFQEFFAQR
ncbi:MAG TPA: alpha/beta fold hydrolase [Candidatus Angelobacter sp.]|nr:alpha/beta fold hydrolase [Candidatus Angelobacter sp.]